MNTKKYIYAIMAMSAAGTLALAIPAYAATNFKFAQTQGIYGRFNGRMGQFRGQMQGQDVFGTVTAINGNSITITSKAFNSTASTTYTIDATNAKITKNNAAGTITSIAVNDSISAQGTLSGTTLTATSIRDGQMGRLPGVFGTVTAINGNSITVSSKFGPNAAATVYIVDATSAKITKNGVTGTIESIAVNDTISAQGTLNGTTLAATTIRDGQMAIGQGKGLAKGQATTNPLITGNGQPIVAGTVSTISGNIITISNKSNVSYTVDATNAKITQERNTITLAGIKTGDAVIVQGAVNGSNVTASTIIDQARPANATTTNSGAAKPITLGFLGSIGQFFSHLFGF